MKHKTEVTGTFEESLRTLETIVRGLEQGTLPLEDSLDHYAEATKHLKFCYEQLNKAERSIQLLRGLNPDGTAVSEPLEDSTESLADKQAARAKRRSARSDLRD